MWISRKLRSELLSLLKVLNVEIEELSAKVKVLECSADGHGEWEYRDWVSGGVWFNRFDNHHKVCSVCGKIEYMEKEDWLKEQADIHAKEAKSLKEQMKKGEV